LFLLQRKTSRVGAGLGKTSGWVHRAVLQRNGVEMLAGVEYVRIDDAGLHITVHGEARVLEVDHIVMCAGQEPLAELMPQAMRRLRRGARNSTKLVAQRLASDLMPSAPSAKARTGRQPVGLNEGSSGPSSPW
jgi:2,4-dienoyl-CoA reductase (NADPH2)